MIIQPNLSEAVTLGKGKEHVAKVSNDATFLMNTVTQIYSEPILAVVREYICNAWDAHISAGKTDIPLEVFYDAYTHTFSVKDFGYGIPEDKISEVYLTVGGSTKRNDDTVTGAWGVGSKVGWAVSDSFTVISCCEGIQTTYNMLKSSDEAHGAPVAKTVISIPTTDTGITVEVNLGHFHNYIDIPKYIKTLCLLGGIKCNFTLKHQATIPTEKTTLLESFDWEKEGNPDFVLVPNSKLSLFGKHDLLIKINNNVFTAQCPNALLTRFRNNGYGILWNYKGNHLYPDMSRERLVSGELTSLEVDNFVKNNKFFSHKLLIEEFNKVINSWTKEELEAIVVYNAHTICRNNELKLENTLQDKIIHTKEDIVKAILPCATRFSSECYTLLDRKMQSVAPSKIRHIVLKGNRQCLDFDSLTGMEQLFNAFNKKFRKTDRSLSFSILHKEGTKKISSRNSFKCFLSWLREPNYFSSVHIYSSRFLKQWGCIHSDMENVPMQVYPRSDIPFSILVSAKQRKTLDKTISIFKSFGIKTILHGFALENGQYIDTIAPTPREPAAPKPSAKLQTYAFLLEKDKATGIVRDDLIVLYNKKKGFGIDDYNTHDNWFINNHVQDTHYQMGKSALIDLVHAKVPYVSNIKSYNKAVSQGKKTLADFISEQLPYLDMKTLMFSLIYLNIGSYKNVFTYNNSSSYIDFDLLSAPISLTYYGFGRADNSLVNFFMRSSLLEPLVPALHKPTFDFVKSNQSLCDIFSNLIPLDSTEKNLISELNNTIIDSPYVEEILKKVIIGFGQFCRMIHAREKKALSALKFAYNTELGTLYLNTLLKDVL